MTGKNTNSKENMIRKCKNIRDRIYDREQLPSAIFKREVLRLVSPDSVIVDIGCGRDATFLRWISPHVSKAYGIDLEVSETVIDSNIRIMHGDAEEIPLCDSGVDVVTLVNVVEHLCNPSRVFLECKRILRPTGSLVLITTNKYHPPILVGLAFPHRIRQWANKLITGTENEDTFPTYYRANSARALSYLACSAGLKPVDIRYLSNHPQYLMFSTFAYRSAVAIERNVFQLEAFSWLRQHVFCHFKNI